MPDDPAPPKKIRLDNLLLARGLATSRTGAQALVMAGLVFAGGRRLEKPGQTVAADIDLEVRGRPHPWVSRGGVKLAHGLTHFGISPEGRVCLDVGSSTGGFTDVLIQGGAKRVYAVDVGRGQLDWQLRQNPRVVVLEQVNARRLSREQVPEPVGLIVCDASFIGLETVLPAPMELAAPDADLVALIKPQFEVGKDQVGKGGVVRDAELREAVCRRIEGWLEAQAWNVRGTTPSPMLGPKGNREFLIAARRGAGAGEAP